MYNKSSMERLRLKRMLDSLASKEGRGTEMVSLYVPYGRQISEVTSMLKDEWGTASNIKSNTTRKNVQDAIVKVIQRLKLFKKVPKTGLSIFCGAIPQNGVGSEKLEIYVVIPPEPINVYLYRCDAKFHIKYLKEFLKEKETFGIVVLDSSGAAIASLKGRRLNMLRECTSGISGKHRAGGQSARRFERVRESLMLDFFKRVGKYINEAFLEIDDLKGIILGGPGPVKYDFEKRDYVDYRLKEKIVSIVDTAYLGEQGVNEILEGSTEIIKNVRYVEEKRIVQDFLYEVGHDTGLATYGENYVRASLETGSVKTLLLSETLQITRVTFKCSSCGFSFRENVKSKEVSTFKESVISQPCTKCSVQTIQVEEENDIIEEFFELAESASSDAELISNVTEEGQMLEKAFGGIAAILRFKTQLV